MKQFLPTALLGKPALRGTLWLLLAATFLTPNRATAQCTDRPAITYTQEVRGSADRIAMEAERFTKSAPSTHAGHGANVAWNEFTSNAAGNAAYVRIPTTDQNVFNLPADGAELGYNIDFVRTGTYYVYLRYRAGSGTDNSVHLGLNGRVFQESWHLDVSNTEWFWRVAPVAMQVTTTGVHNFSIHQREDGVDIDRIVITSAANQTYTGFGPTVTETVASNAVKQPYNRIGYAEDSRTGHGFITIEAEAPTNDVAGNRTYACREWKVGHDAQASYGCFMVTPELGERSDSSNFRQAPRLDFELEMDRADRYYIHIRHLGTTLNNSAWITVNDRLISRFHLSLNNTAWVWDKAPESFVRPDGDGNVIFSVYMREDNTPIDKIILTTDPHFTPTGFGPSMTIESPPDLVFQQQSDEGRTVELPMEFPSRRWAGTHEYEALQWKNVHDTTALNRYYAIVPNSGTDPILSGDLSHKAPIQEFDINFIDTGKHYLFARHMAPNDNNNSFTYYLDGQKVQEYHIRSYSANGWSFYNVNEPASFNVTTPGLHTLRIAMREDGTPLDHIVISNDAAYMAPAGLPMPITLVDFLAIADGSANVLQWTSSFEANTDYHRIERSNNGRNAWENIGQVAAAGDSEGLRDYAFTDHQPFATTYYRLTTVDLDGTTSTSPIVSVTRQTASVQLAVFPNPATDRATLSFNHQEAGEAMLRLTSLAGQLVATRNLPVQRGQNEVNIPLDRLTPGTYVLSFMLSGELQTQRIVVTR